MESTAKIIVVDDEERICRNIKKILSKNNFNVTHALSAREAIEKMTREPFSLMISDIVMPEENGIELLKHVKKDWPQTKAIMMTAYASTDTAVKAIRLGALDYLPKPFTPEELRNMVQKALAGEIVEAPTSEAEREAVDVIDLDIPFETDEVMQSTGEDYAKMLSRSDMPVVEVKMPAPLPGFCETGNMVCDIFKKLGATCKAGTKTGDCPQKKRKKIKRTEEDEGIDVKSLIGIDQPFSYDEVVSVTGPEYVLNLHREGISFIPYEELKKNAGALLERNRGILDIDFKAAPELRRPEILVIDDEVAVNNNIRKILEKNKLQVDQALNKAEALKKIRTRPYKIVLLDLKMPGVKGLELLEAIRSENPMTKVIIITGYASIETAVESARLGAFDYLAKPFTPDEIRNVTTKAFRLAA